MVVRLTGFWLVLLPLLALACGPDSESLNPARPSDARPAATRTASGPSASLDPARGRPGTEVVVLGSGWTPGASVTITGAVSGTPAQPYAMVTAANDGSFTARFRLDRSPSGDTLNPGRLNLVALSGSTSVTLPFEVTPPAPGGPGAGPGG